MISRMLASSVLYYLTCAVFRMPAGTCWIATNGASITRRHLKNFKQLDSLLSNLIRTYITGPPGVPLFLECCITMHLEHIPFVFIVILTWSIPAFGLSSSLESLDVGSSSQAFLASSIRRREALPIPVGHEVESSPFLGGQHQPPQHQNMHSVELGYGPHFVHHRLDPENRFQRLDARLHPDARQATRQASERLQGIEDRMEERARQLGKGRRKEDDPQWKLLLTEKEDVARQEACRAKKIHYMRIAEMQLFARQRQADEECAQGCVNGCSGCCDRVCWPFKTCAGGIESCLRQCYRSLPFVANSPKEHETAEHRKVHHV